MQNVARTEKEKIGTKGREGLDGQVRVNEMGKSLIDCLGSAHCFARILRELSRTSSALVS